jgi:SAM-dependent methyltransferase
MRKLWTGWSRTMHNSALLTGHAFLDAYLLPGMTVVDVGGMNVNGSLRPYFESRGIFYISVDQEADPSVDVVCPSGQPLPFEDGSVDAVVSTSCFEHDPFFWLTFREMCRIVKNHGFVYLNAPSTGPYHGYPGDCWRFYKDAGAALVKWSGMTFDGKSYPMRVIEAFHNAEMPWQDYVMVAQKAEGPGPHPLGPRRVWMAMAQHQ